jgi:ATP-dependent helicase/nuclease subunit B
MTRFPERIFTGWDAPALRLAAGVLADRYGADGVLRLDGAAVVVPGARAGRRLKELLVEEAERRGLRLVPPRVLTVGHLPELFYEPYRPLSDPVLERRVWATVLAETSAEALAPVFPELPEPGDMRGWHVLAREVGGLHREVGAAGLDFADVAERCAAGLLFDDRERWETLAQVQARFRERLERLGLIDPESARVRALASRGLRLDRELWLVGVAEMPEVARRFLHRATAAVHALVHAPEAEAERFDRYGCVLPDAWAGVELELPDEMLAVRDTPADQAAEALAWVAGLDGRYAADQVSVGVPDEELVPYVEQSLGGAGLPVRYAVGLPAERTAPYRLLSATADYLEAGRFAALAALVRHPNFADWLDRSARSDERLRAPGGPHPWIDRLDRFFNDRLPAALPLSGGANRVAAGEIRQLVEALADDDLLGRFHGTKSLSGWMQEIVGLVVSVYGRARIRRHEPRGHTVLEFASQLRTAAAGFRALPPALGPECDAATAIRLLLDELAGGQIPPEGDDPSIELVGWLELHLDDAPAAVLTGFNEPFLPESINAHRFLPNALRSALGLEDNALRYARDAYRLAAIVHSTRDLRLIAGRRSATGDPLRPSRLMFAESGERLARRVRRFYGEAQDEAREEGGGNREQGAKEASSRSSTGESRIEVPAVIPAEAGIHVLPDRAAATSNGEIPPVPAEAGIQRHSTGPIAATGARTGFPTPPQPILRGETILDRLSVTAFRQLLENPYLFALEKVLRLESIDDVAREMDGAAFGTLAHVILARFASTGEAEATNPKDVAHRLEALLDEELESRAGNAALPAVRLQFEQLRHRLQAFASWQARRAADGWRIWLAECEVRDPGASFPVDGIPFSLTGRIDRIDYHAADGRWDILDYKTGDKGDDPEKTHRRGRAPEKFWVDLQLPLYRHLAASLPESAGLAPPAMSDPVALGYLLLPADPRAVRCLHAAWTTAELAPADDVAREVIRFLRENRFEFDPGRSGRTFDERLDALLGVGILTAPPATENGENGGNGEEEAT